jgi:peptidoglycan/LPS O-acetylase OafA/YrhL
MQSTTDLPAEATGASSSVQEMLTRPNRSFVPSLDFVRTVAVLLVVLDHTLLALHIFLDGRAEFIGLLGVWMFFVHTSLVLMWSLERRPYTLDFYIRRVFRIYPLALFAIFVALITRFPLLGGTTNFFQYHPASPGNVVATALLVYNLVPQALHYHPIVSVIYTLPMEVQMYVFLPMLFAFARRELRIWPLLLMWAVVWCAGNHWFASSVNVVTATSEFIPGVIAFVAYKRLQPKLPSWLFPVALALLIALMVIVPRIWLGGVFALAVALLLPCFRGLPAGIFTKACHYVAKYSYGIYLSHQFALVLGIYLLPGRPVALQLGVEFATIAVVSVAAYHLLEKPMIDLGSRLAARAEVMALAKHPGVPRNAL